MSAAAGAIDGAIPDPIRARIASGGVALGLIVRLAQTADIARVARASGHDFLFIDAQHAIFSRETIAGLIAASLGCGIAALVRVRGHDDPECRCSSTRGRAASSCLT